MRKNDHPQRNNTSRRLNMSNNSKPTLPQSTAVRLLSASELDAVAGGMVKKPPVCKPIYQKPGTNQGA
jgi:hypothetical protein